MLPREGDHIRGWIDAQRRAARQAIGDLRGDLAIAAAHVENALTIGQRQAGDADTQRGSHIGIGQRVDLERGQAPAAIGKGAEQEQEERGFDSKA